MKVFFKRSAILLLSLVALYFLHVPILKLVTHSKLRPNLAEYLALEPSIENNEFSVNQVFHGRVTGVLFDPERFEYLVFGRLLEQLETGYSDWHLVYLDQSGAVIEKRNITHESIGPSFEDEWYIHVLRDNQSANLGYDFSWDESPITLAHYQFETLKRWPYLTYFIPVIETNWKGAAFIDVPFDEGVLKLRLATDFIGGYLYSNARVDGRVYVRSSPDSAAGLAFFEVGETSYLRGPDGGEIHRDGFGLYVISRK